MYVSLHHIPDMEFTDIYTELVFSKFDVFVGLQKNTQQ